MKQTNNAIKFLMAQYRAIFQNAYFKGLATAAVVTMGLAAGQAQAADFSQAPLAGTDPITWNEKTTNDATSLSGSGEQQWNAPLTVTNQSSDNANYKIAANGGDLTLSGTGSLTVETSNADHGISLESAAGGTLNVDISTINVNAGLLDIKGAASKAATVVADEITIGAKPSDSVGRASPVEAKIVLNAATDKFKAELGDINSSVKLYEHGTIEFKGSGADFAILNGNLDGSTGGTLAFTNNGTLKTYSTEAIKANITVAAQQTASLKLGDNEAGKQTLSLGEGSKITLTGHTATGGKLEVASGTLDLDPSVVIEGSTATKGTLSVAKGATLKAGATQIKNFLATSSAEGILSLAGTWELQGSGADLDIGGLEGAADTAGKIAGIAATTSVKGQDITVSTKLTTFTNANIKASGTLTLGKADADSEAMLGGANATAKDLVLLTQETAGFNLADDITLTAVSGTDGAEQADSVTLEEKIVLAGNGKTLTVNGGNYTAADLTIGSGSVMISNHADNVDSTLTIDKLVLNNATTTAAGTITASGATSDDLERVVLDLTNTDISYDKNKTSETVSAITLSANKATIKIAGDKLTELLNVEDNFKGAIFDVNNGGQLLVTEGLELGAAQLDASSVTNNGIKLQIGKLNVDGELKLSNAKSVGFGKNDHSVTLQAKKLSLNLATGDVANESATLTSGDFIVTEQLSTNSDKGIVISDNGLLKLGDKNTTVGNIYANTYRPPIWC